MLSQVSAVGQGVFGWGVDPFLNPGPLQLVPARCMPVPQR